MPDKMKSGMMYRSIAVEEVNIDKEKRTIELSFSSEAECPAWYGTEILDHSEGAVRLSRINSKAPFLDMHDLKRQIGVIEKAWIDPATRKGRAVVRVGSSALAEEIFKDMCDGIRVNVSVGYRVHKIILEEESEGNEKYRAVDWEPYEISSVSAPADITVGIGRSEHGAENEIIIEKRGAKMPDTNPQNQKEPAVVVNENEIRMQGQKAERARVSEINAIAQQYGLSDEARSFIDDGKSVEEFRKIALEKIHERNAKPLKSQKPASDLGLSDNEKRGYSFMRALNALASKDWKGAEFERECSEAIEKRLGRTATGVFVPLDVQNQRDFDGSTAAKGGTLIGTDLKSESFIELLRNRLVVKQAGATVLSGLVGNVDIPKATGGLNTYWVPRNESLSTVGQSEASTGKISLTPKTIGVFTDLGRGLIKQASIGVEQYVRKLLAEDIALGIDKAALSGATGGDNPAGVLYSPGVAVVELGANADVPTHAKIVELESKIAAANADIGNLVYITNAAGRGKLKTTKIDAGSGLMLWQNGNNGEGMLNGYRAIASNQIPCNLTKGTHTTADLSALIFGNWADLVIGEWGILDLNVDTSVNSLAGGIRVIALQDVDIALRRAESFAVIKDMITA